MVSLLSASSESFSAELLSSQPDQACTGAGISSISVYALEQCEEKWINHLIVWHLEEQNTQNILLPEDSSKPTPLLFSTYPQISPCCPTFLCMFSAWSWLIQIIKIFLVLGIPKLHRILWMQSQVLCTEGALPLFCWPHFLMQPNNNF